MISTIKILFVGAPSKATIQNQLLLLSNKLPIQGQFVNCSSSAISYLRDCNAIAFPDVLILDEDLGVSELQDFLKTYRQEFYMKQMDSLLFVSSVTAAAKKRTDTPPLVAGFLRKPLNKVMFLEEIYPMISFTVL